jgi:hypothetical protein
VIVDERTHNESKYCLEFEPGVNYNLKGLGPSLGFNCNPKLTFFCGDATHSNFCTQFLVIGVKGAYEGLAHPGTKNARFRRASKLSKVMSDAKQ